MTLLILDCLLGQICAFVNPRNTWIGRRGKPDRSLWLYG